MLFMCLKLCGSDAFLGKNEEIWQNTQKRIDLHRSQLLKEFAAKKASSEDPHVHKKYCDMSDPYLLKELSEPIVVILTKILNTNDHHSGLKIHLDKNDILTIFLSPIYYFIISKS
ncbi:MAG: hypothetical protein OXC30_00690 [Alphaproteobacteria bacterium]|nr:hypothetical protein [Alphaproteobacteria bacterium]